MDQETRYDMVIHNGLVVTVDDRFQVFDPGLVCIAAGTLERVEAQDPHGPPPGANRVIDARGGIIMPGLVNTHNHAAMSLFRGLADDLPLSIWLNDHIFKAEARWLSPESVYAGTRLSCAEMLLSGTTTFCDGYFFEDAVAEAVKDAGMRAVVAQGILDFAAPGVPDPRENVAEAARFIEAWTNRSPLITPGLFCHSPYTCSEETLKTARRVADDTGCLFQIHVAETRGEVEEIRRMSNLSPVQFLDRLDVLNPATLLVHAIWVDEADMAVMAGNGVGVSVTTGSEMKLASGVAPLPSFVEDGIAVGLGTDSCASNNTQDMFREMDISAKLHKAHRMDPTVLNARQILTLATMGGAAALGLEAQIGSLEAGKRADLVVVDTRKPHLTPLYDPVSHLVYSAGGSDVSHVIVDGRLVVCDGALLTLDVDETVESVRNLARQISASR